jgi:hypothetical protein
MTFKLVLALALLSSPAAAADPTPVGPFVSVENATFHQLVFANDDVAILNNLYPPHSDSGFHLHPRELFYVVVAPARASTQKIGQPMQTPRMAPAGTVGFNVMTSEPFVHRVVNADTRPYHVVAVEIRRPTPLGRPVSVRSQSSGYEQVFDNNRLRAWRIILKPGQATQSMMQKETGVRVVVRGGLLRTTQSEIPDQTLALDSGNFALQAAGGTRILRNIGKTTIELVELELK